MRKNMFAVLGILLISITVIGLSLKKENLKSGRVLIDECDVKWTAPIKNNDTNQYYIVIDNECSFAVQVKCRNGRIDYGAYLGGGEKGKKLTVSTIGGTIEDDYSVSATKAGTY